MATDPNAPPETIVLGEFHGIKNTVAAERLQQGELEVGINIDLDDTGQARRRRGYTKRAEGNFHSLWNAGKEVLGVRNGQLGLIGNGFVHTPLMLVGPERLAYVTIGATTYFSSSTASGKYRAGVISPWGTPAGQDQWLSPVRVPTETLGAIGGKLLGPPPMATAIEYFRGRIYMAHKNVLWATELYLYDLVDKTKNFYTFEHDITLLSAVEDGLYVGTTAGLYFLHGVFGDGQKRDIVGDFGVIAGSNVMMPASQVHPQARQGPFPEGRAIMFLTTEGVCAAFDGGQVYNLTRGRVVFPDAPYAAGLYRTDLGGSSYVAVADSAGTPSANARIGDYVDAEIRRFQGG